jgi:hypothetical protein
VSFPNEVGRGIVAIHSGIVPVDPGQDLGPVQGAGFIAGSVWGDEDA